MRRLYRYIALPRHDQRLLTQAALVLVTVWGGLRLLPFQKLCQLIAQVPPTPARRSPDRETDIMPILWALDVASQYVPKATCLTRALALQVLLRRQGQTSRLHIGVAKSQAHILEAHAWVEYQGRVVLGDSSDLCRYTPLPLFGTDREMNRQ
jgi:hypothetical protein